jgi:hypothetical protein
MASKYSSWNKYMLSFTVPSSVRGKTIKNGRYTKLRELIKIRAYIGKLLNNSSYVKYFMNIELGKKYSNPHIHIQLWIKDSTSSTPSNIFNKTITKFSLNKHRCKITSPEKDIDIYNYVIKDYAKDLSDEDLWNLETQKKRMRKQLGSKVRFYSKSSDRFSKKIYRIMYYSYGIVRENVEKAIDFFIKNFFFIRDKKDLKFIVFFIEASKLSYIEQEKVMEFLFEVLATCRGPPGICFTYIARHDFNFRRFIMIVFRFRYFIRIRGPPFS